MAASAACANCCRLLVSPACFTLCVNWSNAVAAPIAPCRAAVLKRLNCSLVKCAASPLLVSCAWNAANSSGDLSFAIICSKPAAINRASFTPCALAASLALAKSLIACLADSDMPDIMACVSTPILAKAACTLSAVAGAMLPIWAISSAVKPACVPTLARLSLSFATASGLSIFCRAALNTRAMLSLLVPNCVAAVLKLSKAACTFWLMPVATCSAVKPKSVKACFCAANALLLASSAFCLPSCSLVFANSSLKTWFLCANSCAITPFALPASVSTARLRWLASICAFRLWRFCCKLARAAACSAAWAFSASARILACSAAALSAAACSLASWAEVRKCWFTSSNVRSVNIAST